MARWPERARATRGRGRASVEGHESLALSAGWQAACEAPDRHPDVERLDERALDGLAWIPARVPGTAAGALRDAGGWRAGDERDFDAEDWLFRTRFDAKPAADGEQVVLLFDGIATVAEVYLNGERILASDSMFAAHELDVGTRLRAGAAANELTIRCRALKPLLAESRRPRARWRTKLVSERNLRFFRTMLLGRAPGFAPGPAVVGPWRGVRLERRRRIAVEGLRLRPRVQGEQGVLTVAASLRALAGARVESVEVELTRLLRAGADGDEDGKWAQTDASTAHAHRARLTVSGTADEPTASGELRVPGIERWWPHTHGEPVLYGARLMVSLTREGVASDGEAEPAAAGRAEIAIDAGRVGFRELAFGARPDHEILVDGIDLHVNGVNTFVRGAVWTPLDPAEMAPSEDELRAALEQAQEAGMNMVRLPGTGAYESKAFWDLCDELGMLVWQDFMFANFDYPIADEPFRETVEREARDVLAAVSGRPSLAVLCGNSEVEQQVAMLGLDPALGRGELFGELLPGLVAESGVDAAYVPSAPCGGGLPFRPDVGIANYYGVGGYRRPIEDARRAEVRFAAECLAFSNVPAGEYAQENGVPQDEGADWDFKTVRDHYLGLLYDIDPAELEREDRERYVQLAREATGEAMAEVFGEWRRASSTCGGGLVLWLRDLSPGAGWGLIDSDGVPKPAYRHLARALAPVAVWTIDEGLGGIVAHVANDRPEPLQATLRVACYRGGDVLVEQASAPVELAPNSNGEWNIESVLGHFADASWAYRFGPPAQDAIVVSLERDGAPPRDGVRPQNGASPGDGDGDSDSEQEADRVICQAIRFPAGRPLDRESDAQLGLTARLTKLASGAVEVELRTGRLLYGVRVEADGLQPSDGGFFIEPGTARTVTLRPSTTATRAKTAPERLRVMALNMDGSLELAFECDALATSGASP